MWRHCPFAAQAAFSALFKHSSGTTALEIGDGKADVSAEWLQLLCAGVSGHPTLQRLSLRRVMINAATPSAAHAGLHGLSSVLRDSLELPSIFPRSPPISTQSPLKLRPISPSSP